MIDCSCSHASRSGVATAVAPDADVAALIDEQRAPYAEVNDVIGKVADDTVLFRRGNFKKLWSLNLIKLFFCKYKTKKKQIISLGQHRVLSLKKKE